MESWVTYEIFNSLKVLYTFDDRFFEEFDGKDGKSSKEHMIEIIKIVENAYKDKTFKTNIGTVINIEADMARYKGSMHDNIETYISTESKKIEQKLRNFFLEQSQNAGDYDVFIYVSHPGAGGRAGGIGTICDKDGKDWERFNVNMAYGSNECWKFQSQLDCTPTNRIVLTAEVINYIFAS